MLVFPSVLCNYFYVFINCCFGSSIEALPSLVHSNSKISKVWQTIDCSYAVGLSRLGLDLYFRALSKQLSKHSSFSGVRESKVWVHVDQEMVPGTLFWFWLLKSSAATSVKTIIMHEKALTQSPFRNTDYQWMEKVQNLNLLEGGNKWCSYLQWKRLYGEALAAWADVWGCHSCCSLLGSCGYHFWYHGYRVKKRFANTRLLEWNSTVHVTGISKPWSTNLKQWADTSGKAWRDRLAHAITCLVLIRIWEHLFQQSWWSRHNMPLTVTEMLKELLLLQRSQCLISQDNISSKCLTKGVNKYSLVWANCVCVCGHKCAPTAAN